MAERIKYIAVYLKKYDPINFSVHILALLFSPCSAARFFNVDVLLFIK